jgi:hypothetical protein
MSAPNDIEPGDFTPEGAAKLVVESSDMLDDWYEARGIVTYRRKLRNEVAALSAKLAEAEREIDRLKLVLGDPEGTIAHADAIVARAEAAEARAAELEKALCRPASGWSDAEAAGYDNGQCDASMSIAEAILTYPEGKEDGL